MKINQFVPKKNTFLTIKDEDLNDEFSEKPYLIFEEEEKSPEDSSINISGIKSSPQKF